MVFKNHIGIFFACALIPFWYGLRMKIGTFIKSREMSHEAFGKIVGVTQATINRYVRGERFPSPEMIRKIHEATEGAVSVADWYETEAAE